MFARASIVLLMLMPPRRLRLPLVVLRVVVGVLAAVEDVSIWDGEREVDHAPVGIFDTVRIPQAGPSSAVQLPAFVRRTEEGWLGGASVGPWLDTSTWRAMLAEVMDIRTSKLT